MAMASDDNIRCAQCTFVVLHIFPEMMQDLLAATELPPSVLYRMIKNNSRINLKKYERKTVQTMTTDGYTKLDISVMYKIIKYFKLIDPPTRNWGANPLPNETELGDDIERMRKARNHLVHKVDANVSEQSFTEFFENSITVSRRLDKYLKKPEGSSYEKRIQQYKSYLLDKTGIEQLLGERKKEESLKNFSTCSLESQQTEVHIMKGKSMDDILENVKSIEGDSVSPIKIIIHGIEVSEDNVDVINSFKNYLKTDNITFKKAEKNCIILFADIKNKALQDHTLFEQEVNCLIRKVFRLCKLPCKADETIYAVVTSAEEEFDQDNLEENEEEGPNLFGNDDNLVLHVDIKNKALLSNETVGQVFTEFLDTVIKTGDGQQFLGKKDVHAVLVPDEEGELEEARQESLSFQKKIIFNWKLIKKRLTAVEIIDSFISEELVSADIREYIKNESSRSQMDSILSNVLKYINTSDDYAKFENAMTTHNMELQTPSVELTMPGNRRTEDHLRSNRKLIEKELYPKDYIDNYLEWFILSPEDHEDLRSKENVRQHMAHSFLVKIMQPASIEKGSMARLLESFQSDQNCILMRLSKLMDSVLQNGISHIIDDNDLRELTKMREDCRNSLLREWIYLNENLYPYSILIDELHNGGLVDEDRADIIREKPRREQVYLTLRNIIRRIDRPEMLSKLISILKKENNFIAEKLWGKSNKKAVPRAKQYDFRQLSGSDVNDARAKLQYYKDDIVKEFYATDVDTFVESLVFNVDDHEIICETENGENKKAWCFYEKISDKEYITRGSFDCLVFCLRNNEKLKKSRLKLAELLLSKQMPGKGNDVTTIFLIQQQPHS
ncbi:unnamed protein product [Mytilus coruscus]|uniref:Uncharacterized protein n=1 Tax=Mytilus coruscus TaxID=42192 RepID=A0A6J8EVR6_MYTCO|nr:unnamed protein product [Mytilus coruscus]